MIKNSQTHTLLYLYYLRLTSYQEENNRNTEEIMQQRYEYAICRKRNIALKENLAQVKMECEELNTKLK